MIADTTDVQAVRVEETDNVHSVNVFCNFIIGTDATGCMVELVGELTNSTVKLTRQDNEVESVITHTLPHPLSCYHQVFGIDIESDGSTGTFPISGVIVHVAVFSTRHCSDIEDVPTKCKT